MHFFNPTSHGGRLHLPFFVFLSALLLLLLLPFSLGAPLIHPQSHNQQHLIQSDTRKDAPFTRKHRDPYDHKVDSIGEDLHPLPFRNGDGATIMGPRNRDRERQNPDMMRPPSTDHGDLKNMRWSFADSHVRIEVRAA